MAEGQKQWIALLIFTCNFLFIGLQDKKHTLC